MPGVELELDELGPVPHEEIRMAAVAAKIASNDSFVDLGVRSVHFTSFPQWGIFAPM